MKLVVDMNLSPIWTTLLVGHGHDAVHWRDVGRGAAPDEDIVAWAASDQRAVFTADLDFGAIVVTRALSAPSVIQRRCGSTDPEEIGQRVLQALDAAGSRVVDGAILTIERKQLRFRPGLGRLSDTDQD